MDKIRVIRNAALTEIKNFPSNRRGFPGSRRRDTGRRAGPVPCRSRATIRRSDSLRSANAIVSVLAFAFRQIPRGLLPLLALAKDIGAGSILISDHLGAAAHPKPDCLMMATRGDHEDEGKTLLVPMAIGKALILSITHVKGRPSIDALDRCNDLIKIFEAS
jgi:DNA-binding MurR/RpiR family transcriptional regulator